jgi:NhaP-type Na+/H+ or K+/H+ antiporter
MGLVLLLFTDASRIKLDGFRSFGQLSARLLPIGMLLTIFLGAVTAIVLLPNLSLWEAGILAAILAPTDAGLGQVIVSSPKVPARIRNALNIEAGLNDGMSVPFLMFFIAMSQRGSEGATFWRSSSFNSSDTECLWAQVSDCAGAGFWDGRTARDGWRNRSDSSG